MSPSDGGVICLQGGAEFGADCVEMDADLVRRAGGGPVVVTALAGAVGTDYATATANGVRHFRALGASEVVGAPDVRIDPARALAAIGRARLLVLPGGSPARLRAALATTPAGDLVSALAAGGTVVMGASAGAMLLCSLTVLPDAGPALAVGLGLVPDALVLPHFAGDTARWGELAVPPGTALLGLPECAGLLVCGAAYTAVGTAPSTVILDGIPQELPVGQTWTR